MACDAWHAVSMREGISIEMSAVDRGRLERIAVDRNSKQKHVWWSWMILATSQGCGNAEIMRRGEVWKPCVWRWQERSMRECVKGLLSDQTRKPACCPCRQPGRSLLALTLSIRPASPRIRPAALWRLPAAYRCARCSVSTRARPPAATGQALQAVHRPGARGPAARRIRSISRYAGAQPRSSSTRSPRSRR